MASGEVLKVWRTDPGSVDGTFRPLQGRRGNELLEQSSGNDEFVHFLRRR